MLSLGAFPAVSLAQARAKAAEYRKALADGAQLTKMRRRERTHEDLQTVTFGAVALEYNQRRQSGNDPRGPKDEKTIARDRRNLRYSKRLHRMTFAEIERADILEVCEALAASGRRDTAKRLGGWFSDVFKYAYDKRYASRELPDPTRQGGTIGSSLAVVRSRNRPALIDLNEVGALLRVIDSSELLITPTVSRALQLAARTAVRPGNIQNAEWTEFDLDGSWPANAGHPTWVIPRHKMKMKDENRTDHIVPLSRQAVAILRAQQVLSGHLKWVFPGARSDAKPISNMAMSAALISFGYRDKQTAHGFRTVFRTLASDVLKVDSEILERQLAHRVGNEVARAYDRSQRIAERRELMQRYSDLLDKLRAGEKV